MDDLRRLSTGMHMLAVSPFGLVLITTLVAWVFWMLQRRLRRMRDRPLPLRSVMGIGAVAGVLAVIALYNFLLVMLLLDGSFMSGLVAVTLVLLTAAFAGSIVALCLLPVVRFFVARTAHR